LNDSPGSLDEFLGFNHGKEGIARVCIEISNSEDYVTRPHSDQTPAITNRLQQHEARVDTLLKCLPRRDYKWRDIAFGTPRLWSTIEVKINLDIPDFISAQVDLLQTWLARSKSCPLSLSVQICVDSDDDGVSLCHLTDTILMHSARLEYANLLIPFDELHWAATQGPFPSLRGLTLGASHYNGPKDAVVAFCDAPTLTTVHLLNFCPTQVELPWS
jgi:hypothetical protein